MNDSQKILRISFNGEVIKSLPLSEFVAEIENFIKLYGNKARKDESHDFSFKKERKIETEKVTNEKIEKVNEKIESNINEKSATDDNFHLKRQNIEIIHFEDEFHEVDSFQTDENGSTYVDEEENTKSHSKKKRPRHSKKIKKIGKEIRKAGKKLLNSKNVKKVGRGLRKLKRKLRL